MIKMSMPLGRRTVTTTVSGCGNLGIEQLVIPGLLAFVAAIAAGLCAQQIEMALTIFALLLLVAVVARPIYVLARDLSPMTPRQRRQVRAFHAHCAEVIAAREQAHGPLYVAAERVHELEAPSPAMAYVVDADREHAPIDLDALEA